MFCTLINTLSTAFYICSPLKRATNLGTVKDYRGHVCRLAGAVFEMLAEPVFGRHRMLSVRLATGKSSRLGCLSLSSPRFSPKSWIVWASHVTDLPVKIADVPLQSWARDMAGKGRGQWRAMLVRTAHLLIILKRCRAKCNTLPRSTCNCYLYLLLEQQSILKYSSFYSCFIDCCLFNVLLLYR